MKGSTKLHLGSLAARGFDDLQWMGFVTIAHRAKILAKRFDEYTHVRRFR